MITVASEAVRLEDAMVRAARGAALLDEKQPDWYEKIDAATLVIASCTRCICGQIYGSYTAGLAVLGLETSDSPQYGFSQSLGNGALEEAWREQIAMRRVKTLVPV